MRRSHYETLGVERSATPKEIRRAFKRLSFAYHPDRNKEPGAEDRFKELSRAFEVLDDPERRVLYDLGELELDEAPFEEPEGEDLHHVLPVDFWIAVRGGVVEFTTWSGREVRLTVPAGARTGTVMRLRGHGGLGSPPGSLLVRLEVGADAQYSLLGGDDLQRELAITWLAAWRGDVLEVSTPWGSIGLELHPGVRDGHAYQQLGHGIRRPDHWGNLRIVVRLEPPPLRAQLGAEAANVLEAALRLAYDGV